MISTTPATRARRPPPSRALVGSEYARRAAQAREIIEEKRETSATVSVAFDAFGHDTEAGGPVLAAALGFRVFLFMVPYVGFLLIVGGYFGDWFDRVAPEDVHDTRESPRSRPRASPRPTIFRASPVSPR